MGRGRGRDIAWQRLWERVRVQLGRRQAFDDDDALKFFFFIIRLNYRKFEMIFKREN